MSKTIPIAACAAVLLCAVGCSKESEYEKCLRESLRNVPEILSRKMIENSLEKYRAMSADEQRKTLDALKTELAK